MRRKENAPRGDSAVAGIAKKADDAVRSFLVRLGILADDRVAVAFSGGADSLSLLISLSRLHGDTMALYVNHHLRDERELASEMALNSENAARLGIKLVVLDADRSEIDRLCKVMGLEGAARDVRYRLIREYCESNGIRHVFTAHNRDDCDETDIINFFRGGSLSRTVDETVGIIHRPFLSITHAQNEEHVRVCGFEFSQDSTNLQPDALRTSIRHRLKPVLNEVFPSYSNALEQRRKRGVSDDDGHSAVFSAFTLLGYRNSNNNRLKRKNIDALISLAKSVNAGGHIETGDVVALHRKSDLVLVRKDSGSDAIGTAVTVSSEGIYDLPGGGKALVSSIKAKNVKGKASAFPSNAVIMIKSEFLIRTIAPNDTVLSGGKMRNIKELMKKKQVSGLLMSHAYALVKGDSVRAVVFDGLDEKPCICDGENVSDLDDDCELHLIMFV